MNEVTELRPGQSIGIITEATTVTSSPFGERTAKQETKIVLSYEEIH